MSRSIEVTFTPAEFHALRARDLGGSVCVVFDILRATSTMITALANGAKGIIPVAEISEALAVRAREPDVLLAGEREGVRITGRLSGGVEFDLGNSPREFTRERVAGRTIAMTTTNGTRALRACVGAREVSVGSFLNLRAVAERLEAGPAENVILVCAGTHEEAAYEDMLAAGALCELVWPGFVGGAVADSAEIARQIYRVLQRDLLSAMQYSRNGRRLLSLPELAEDVRCCVQRETQGFAAVLDHEGVVRRV